MTDTSHLRVLNTAAVADAEARGASTFDALPPRVTLEITADCNLRCPHCEFTPPRAWKDKHDPRRILHIGIDDLRRFAAAVFPYIREVIPSVVGEPMMYPYWNEFLDLCEEYGVFLEMFTNGTYLTEETLARLTPVISKLIVSMDGASTETFNRLRRPCDFQETLDRLEKVKRWRAGLCEADRPRVVINSTLTLHWVEELPEMVRIAKRYAVDELSVAHLISYSDYWRRYQPATDPERTDRALRAAAAEARRLGVTVHLPRPFGSQEDLSYSTDPAFPLWDKVRALPPPAAPKYWCKYLWREVFISLDGTVAPCCGVGRPAVDNVRKNFDLRAIFSTNPVLAEMREGMMTGNLHPACAKCPQLSMYGGLDYAQVDFSNTYVALEGALAERACGEQVEPDLERVRPPVGAPEPADAASEQPLPTNPLFRRS